VSQMQLVGTVKIPLLGNAPMVGVITPMAGAVASVEAKPEFTIPPEILVLLQEYGKVVGQVIMADLPAVLLFKTKTWKDVLADVMRAVGLAA
jgi:hypothetical protein